jgi:(methylthio)acryloyl-CoA hydratase
VQRMIGTALMTDMMLTGRVLDAEEGRAAGLSTYLVEPGAGLATALDLAARIAENSAVTNFAVLQALPRIAESGPDEGFFMEALMAAVAASSTEAQEWMQEFLAGRGTKVRRL